MITLPNIQPVEHQVHASTCVEGYLDVINVWPTIQGEGPLAGMPAVFVRLAGCNLRCPMCDTNYTEGRSMQSLKDIVAAVEEAMSPDWAKPLVVLTGGEPFRQDITDLVKTLRERGYLVQIETNGTIWQPRFNSLLVDEDIVIVCSPKTNVVHKEVQIFAHCYKYVLQAGQVSEVDGLPLRTLGNTGPVWRPQRVLMKEYLIFVQPLDEQDVVKNQANLQACVDSCMKFGYRLTVQIHKEAGLP